MDKEKVKTTGPRAKGQTNRGKGQKGLVARSQESGVRIQNKKKSFFVLLSPASGSLLLASGFLLLFIASCALPRIIILDDPLTPEEHINLGVTYEKKGELDQALEEYKRAAKKLPRAYLYMGNLFIQQGDLGEAERNYKKAIKKEPELADAYNNLAWLYYTKKENLQEAESLASKAAALNPTNQNYSDTLKKIQELKLKN